MVSAEVEKAAEADSSGPGKEPTDSSGKESAGKTGDASGKESAGKTGDTSGKESDGKAGDTSGKESAGKTGDTSGKESAGTSGKESAGKTGDTSGKESSGKGKEGAKTPGKKDNNGFLNVLNGKSKKGGYFLNLKVQTV